mgnify:FL=1
MDKTKLLKELRSKGYKVTPQRQEIIEVLSEREGHQSAEEVHKQICSHYPAMGLDTVYRNLALLRNLNIVSEINFGGKNRYELNRDGDGHSHHLICLGCGVSQKLDFCPLDYFDWNKMLKKDFKVKNHRFEIFGYCSHCIQIEENEGEGEE